MDDIEKILEKLDRLERSVLLLKNELQDLKANQPASDETEKYMQAIKSVFRSFNDVNLITNELKRVLKHEFKRPLRKVFFDDDEPYGFDFNFDFGNLGNFISNTVQDALSSIQNLTEDLDLDFSPRKARIKMHPGKDLHFTGESVVSDELPSIESIPNAKEILMALENKICSLETLGQTTGLSVESMGTTIDVLKEKKLLIQEKFGQQRFLITKLGKKVLINLKNNSSQNQGIN